MPITRTALTSGNDHSNSLSTVPTASITPTANRLVLAWVYNYKAGGGVTVTPSMTGNSLTWAPVATISFNVGGGTNVRLTLFRALGASPSAGAASIDFAAEVQNVVCWSLNEFAGVDTGGTNGSAAVVQNATATGTGLTTLTVTLAAFGSGSNGAAGGFFLNNVDVTVTPGAGFTAMHQANSGGGDQLFTEWRADNDTTVDCSWTSAVGAIGLAVELAADPTTGGWSLYRPYTLGAALTGAASGLFYYWRRRKQEKPDE